MCAFFLFFPQLLGFKNPTCHFRFCPGFHPLNCLFWVGCLPYHLSMSPLQNETRTAQCTTWSFYHVYPLILSHLLPFSNRSSASGQSNHFQTFHISLHVPVSPLQYPWPTSSRMFIGRTGKRHKLYFAMTFGLSGLFRPGIWSWVYFYIYWDQH